MVKLNSESEGYPYCEEGTRVLWNRGVDAISFNALINACQQSGRWALALHILFDVFASAASQ